MWTPNDVRSLVKQHVPSLASLAEELVQVTPNQYEVDVTLYLPIYLRTAFKQMKLKVIACDQSVLKVEWIWSHPGGGYNGFTVFYAEVPPPIQSLVEELFEAAKDLNSGPFSSLLERAAKALEEKS